MSGTTTTEARRGLLRSPAAMVGLVVGIPLSIVLFWLAFRGADLAEVWSSVADADARLVALALVAMAAVYTGQALRWRAIARTPEVSTVRFVEMVVSGVAVNNVVPGRIGDILRARWLQTTARIPAGRALASVFVDRAFDVLALVVFLTSLAFVSNVEWLRRIAIAGLVLLLTVGLVLVVARLYTQMQARERTVQRGRLRRIARDMVDALSEPLGRVRALALALLSLTTWAAWALGAWLVARSVGIDVSPIEAVFLTAVINLGVAVPSSPGFIGTYQWLGVNALALLEVGTEQALAFAILMHAVWYVPTTLVGGALLLGRAVGALASRQAAADERPQNA